MNKKSISSNEALCVALLMVCSSISTGQPASAAGGPHSVPNMASNDPDQFAWHLLTAVARPADNGTEQSLWQTWAEQSTVYASACEAPQWPGPDAAEPPARGSRLVDILKNQGVSADDFNALTGACNLQQVKINRPFFNYVVEHDLWYQEGVIRQASTEGIDFPVDAVVFKADWKLISPEDMPLYHWRKVSTREYEHAFGSTSDCVSDLPDEEMLVLGLDAFHIVSKAIPNWVWTTWNHADTLGRCDYIGCRDDFGSDPAEIPPHREMGRPYDPGKLTPAARQLLDAAGLDQAWRHYRLMGTMVTFTDLTGRPNLLGNAVLEPGFGNTSSCSTCHAMATYSATGSNLDFLKSTQPFEGFVGTPDPGWFYPAQTGRPATPIVYQTDFMWQLATETESRQENCGSSS